MNLSGAMPSKRLVEVMRLSRDYSRGIAPAFNRSAYVVRITSETSMSDSGIDRLARALGMGSGSSRAADKSSSRPFKKKDVPSLAQYIQSDTCRKIYLMVIFILILLCVFCES